ncbi:uncharacterized protein LOC126374603 [Pectinophora gossypiella]|uniref:uncharacterized protein LOC126374603 n=1 Tax=Pectinophora gossypiella TaxID=13191 RepID=UPI00214E7086|nr:uncharacterized protein LOC126374603 [Pectinophora gossypiella]
MLVFKAGKGPATVPPVFLDGSPVRVVETFKYLGHILTDSLNDDADLERERRALAVRCNMLARSASGMFAGARVPDFYSILRARTASFWDRLRNSQNGILMTISEDFANPFAKHWTSLHRPGKT